MSEFPTTPILDDFNRADESPIAAPWGQLLNVALSDLDLVGNQVQGDITNPRGSVYQLDTFTDCEVYARVNLPAENMSATVFWRISDPGTASLSGYLFDVMRLTGDFYRLRCSQQLSDGSVADLTTGLISEPSLMAIGARMIETGISVLIMNPAGWLEVGTATDAAFSSGALGLALQGAGAVATADDFGGGAYIPVAQQPRKTFLAHARRYSSPAKHRTYVFRKRKSHHG